MIFLGDVNFKWISINMNIWLRCTHCDSVHDYGDDKECPQCGTKCIVEMNPFFIDEDQIHTPENQI